MQTARKTISPEQRAEQIAREYRDFAYIVSHDLNAPLRHVREFTRLLIGSRSTAPAHDEQQYVEFIEKSLQRLDNMQVALLNFSRLNTRPETQGAINLNVLIEKIIDQLSPKIKERPTEIIYNNLPTVTGEPQKIRMLFYHLIENALIFHTKETAICKIMIKAEDQGDNWQCSVTDNGIGIAPQYHQEVFRLFRRLEPELYATTGTGLTMAQKIVERHNGQIWINSTEGKGTTLYVTLPK